MYNYKCKICPWHREAEVALLSDCPSCGAKLTPLEIISVETNLLGDEDEVVGKLILFKIRGEKVHRSSFPTELSLEIEDITAIYELEFCQRKD